MDPDAIMHPRGPEPAGVYWRRRLVSVGAVVLLFVVGFKACGGGDPSTLRSANPTNTPAASTTPGPTGGSQPSTQPSTSSSSPAATGGGDCADTDIKVEAVASSRVYEAGIQPKLTIRITNISGAPCRRDIGQENREILVYSGADRIWSNRDCNPATGKRDVRLLAAGEKKEYALEWSRTRSAKGCPTPRPEVEPGTYRAHARLGTITVKGDVFSLR